jgi:phosphoglycerate dehydrogenase-like enzyme
MPEPPVAGSEMYKMRNIILTPHLAGSIGLEVQRMGEYMFDESRRWLAGEPTFWGVTEKMLETMA